MNTDVEFWKNRCEQLLEEKIKLKEDFLKYSEKLLEKIYMLQVQLELYKHKDES